jgi:hypothetical protein
VVDARCHRSVAARTIGTPWPTGGRAVNTAFQHEGFAPDTNGSSQHVTARDPRLEELGSLLRAHRAELHTLPSAGVGRPGKLLAVTIKARLSQRFSVVARQRVCLVLRYQLLPAQQGSERRLVAAETS